MRSEEELIQRLVELYEKKGKHSQYQAIIPALKKRFGELQRMVKTKYEKERFKYIISNIRIKGKRILDIGSNLGFFAFESLNNGAKEIKCYEGDNNLSEIIQITSNLLGFSNRIKIINEYYDFFNTQEEYYDIIFLLNVLHHIGDDFGDKNITINQSLELIAQALQKLAYYGFILVFQMGFNWKGNINFPLFKKGTKREMIEFIKKAILNFWEIKKIGIAEKIKGKIFYVDLNEKNILRDDSLGEFLNRPIFILESLIRKK